jgi:hypothetical protein
VNNATTLAPKQALTNRHAIFWGGLVAGVLDATDGVIAYGTQGLNPIQVLQYIASGALGKSAFQGRSCYSHPRCRISFPYRMGGRGAIRICKPTAKGPQNACCLPAGLFYGAAVYFFMNYLVLPLSAVAASTFQLGLFLNGVIGHSLFVGLPISIFARRLQ